MKLATLALLAAAGLSAALAQQSAESYLAQHDRLYQQAKAAFDREMAREKSGDCPKAQSTREILDCLAGESAKSAANVEEYVKSVRALLTLPDPGADAAAAAGPTGLPLTGAEMAAQLDRSEAAWKEYAKAECNSAFGLYQSGSIAPVEQATCGQRVLRAHLHELDALYGEYFSH